jgi:hypothetical protein
MRSSSPCIGALAAALAGAQGDLANPERTATGVLPATRPGGGSRSFRYATLSVGLDIARHALAKREIALLQTTFVDGEHGWLRLQSVLAHASGEWIASDWPVCPLGAALEPHRLGTAMTYARRYALFALIGIAGEDDLDAPDLEVSSHSQPILHAEPLAEQAVGHSRARPGAPHVDAQAQSLRLIAEIRRIETEEELWRWAYWRIREKDALPRALAAAVERRFAECARELQAEADDPLSETAQEERPSEEPQAPASPSPAPYDRLAPDDAPKQALNLAGDLADLAEASNGANGAAASDDCGAGEADARERRLWEEVEDIEPRDSGERAREPASEEARREPEQMRDYSPAGDGPNEALEPSEPTSRGGPRQALPPRAVTPKTLRLRNKAHLEAIGHKSCLVCGRSPADPHHLRFAQPGAMGRKSSDEFVVPLCRLHHDELHRRGDERAWWQSRGIDPLPIALEMWREQGRSSELARG